MDPAISALPSRLFYGGRIDDGDNVVAAGYGGGVQSLLTGAPQPFVFLDVVDAWESAVGSSKCNVKGACNRQTRCHALSDGSLSSSVYLPPYQMRLKLNLGAFTPQQCLVVAFN